MDHFHGLEARSVHERAGVYVIRHVRAILTIKDALFLLDLLAAVDTRVKEGPRLELDLASEDVLHLGKVFEVPTCLGELVDCRIPYVNSNNPVRPRGKID